MVKIKSEPAVRRSISAIMKFCADALDDSRCSSIRCDVGFAPHIIMDGFWEYWITQFIAARMKDGAVVLDVGANFGYYTLLMSDLIGPSGKCIAFEPNPGVAAKLRKTIAINGFESRATNS